MNPNIFEQRLQYTLDDSLVPNTAKLVYGFSTFMITIVVSDSSLH